MIEKDIYSVISELDRIRAELAHLEKKKIDSNEMGYGNQLALSGEIDNINDTIKIYRSYDSDLEQLIVSELEEGRHELSNPLSERSRARVIIEMNKVIEIEIFDILI